MPAYRFVTVWRIDAPIERVFAEVDEIERWPEWWPNVRRVEALRPGDERGLGAAYRMAFVGKLPYQLRFDLAVTRRDALMALSGSATGELEGVGDWTFWEEDGWSCARYVWAIRTTATWMNVLAHLPFVDEIFRLNHHAVMRRGLAGIRGRLGGVAGTYTREA